MTRYFLEKQYIAGYDMGEPYYCSYEAGSYDYMSFSSEKEARKYAEDNLHRLNENEALVICSVNDDKEVKYIGLIKEVR